MKNKNMLFIVAIIIGITGTNQSLYAFPDDAVVDSIKAYSDLNQSDLDRWKLLWLGSAAEPTAMAASVYGMYKAYKVGKALTPSEEKVQNVFKNQIYSSLFGKRKPSETVQNLITSKWTWGTASVAGAGLLAYKMLYLRVQAGLKDKIQNYVSLCERLAVTKRKYNNLQELQNALQAPGNTVWIVSNAIAQELGFINLIEQANIALILIDKLQESGEQQLDVLRNKVLTFKSNAQANVTLIVPLVMSERQQRSIQQVQYGKELDIQRKEAAIAGQQIKNITNQWELLKDIGKTADIGKIAKEYGPSILFGVGTVFGIRKLTETASQLMSTKKEK